MSYSNDLGLRRWKHSDELQDIIEDEIEEDEEDEEMDDADRN